MKPGDKVWFLKGDIITRGTLRCHIDDFAAVEVREVNAGGQVVVRCYYPKTCLLFPTREALCKHYRKVFE